MPNYEHLTRDELLNLAQERTQLTEDARLQLDVELARRNASADEIRLYGRQTVAKERMATRRKQRSTWSIETRNKRLVGKKNYCCDERKRVEEFDTTLWFVVLVPLIPLRSLRIRRLCRKWRAVCPAGQLHVLDVRPLDWDQILSTWLRTLCAIALVLGLIIAIRLYSSH